MSSDYYATIPRKRVHVATLVFNSGGELLILKPTYKKHWSLPGGVVEKDESPLFACIRETKEEAGITLNNPAFLAVQYVSDAEKGDALFFVFDGGVFDNSDVQRNFVPNDEISEWKFVSIDTVSAFVTEGIMTRIHAGIVAKNNSHATYCER